MKSKVLHSVVPTLLAVVFTDAQHADKTMASHPEATGIDELAVETRNDDDLELVQ
jgi:hypothetical protein